jgi:hypothetical protein
VRSATSGTTRSPSRAAWAPRTAPPPWPGSPRSPAGHRSSLSRPARTPGKGSTARRWTPAFLAAPVASKGRLLQYAGRILRPYDGKATAEVHDYHDELTGVLASSLAKRAPGYTSLGFPDPRKLPYTPSAKLGSTCLTACRPDRLQTHGACWLPSVRSLRRPTRHGGTGAGHWLHLFQLRNREG